MESVEEMCDEIALIHKSNKLLDGSLIDIKKQFRSNTFEIGVITQNQEQLKQTLQGKYELGKASFKSLNNEVQLLVSLGNHDANELLHDVIPFGQVTHFVELIPSINDIFIQTVTNN